MAIRHITEMAADRTLWFAICLFAQFGAKPPHSDEERDLLFAGGEDDGAESPRAVSDVSLKGTDYGATCAVANPQAASDRS